MAATTSAIIAATLAASSIQQGRQARKEQRKAARIQRRGDQLRATRNAIDQVKQAQIARAEIIAQGEAMGAGGSSAVSQGAGAVQSQAGGNIAFINQMAELNRLASIRMEKARDFGFRSGALANLSNIVGGMDFSPSSTTSTSNSFGNTTNATTARRTTGSSGVGYSAPGSYSNYS